MDSWKRFNETELPSKDKFYSTLNLEDMLIMMIMPMPLMYGILLILVI